MTPQRPTIEQQTGGDDTSPDVAAPEPTEHDGGTPSNPVHDLDYETVSRGGVTMTDYHNADVKVMPDGTEINSLAWAAAGKTTGDRDISDGERQQNALKIDVGVRAHASWLETRPLMEQMIGMVRPVIFAPPDER